MRKLILRGALSAACAAVLAAVMFSAPVQAQEAPPPPLEHHPTGVMLGQLIQACHPKKLVKGKLVDDIAARDDCASPSPVTRDTIGATTPIFSEDDFVARWPNSGHEGYKAILKQNCDLCNYAHDMVVSLNTLDQLFAQSELTQQDLQGIYDSLPADVKAATRVAQVSQVGQTIAYCLLSGPIYCIGVAIGAVGNIVNMEASKKLQIANIKLSIVDIAVMRLNTYSNRITLRLDGMWLKFAIQGCTKLGFDTPSGLPDLGPIPDVSQVLTRVKNGDY